jgi:hypothetical protein
MVSRINLGLIDTPPVFDQATARLAGDAVEAAVIAVLVERGDLPEAPAHSEGSLTHYRDPG